MSFADEAPPGQWTWTWNMEHGTLSSITSRHGRQRDSQSQAQADAE
jgi:hypothetical protein